MARVPLDELVDPAHRYRLRHPSGFVGPAFDVADMVVWGFTAALLDAILTASGLAAPWDTDDVRPMPDAAVHRARLPGTVDGEDDEDSAAPMVADPAPDGPPASTVSPQ